MSFKELTISQLANLHEADPEELENLRPNYLALSQAFSMPQIITSFDFICSELNYAMACKFASLKNQMHAANMRLSFTETFTENFGDNLYDLSLLTAIEGTLILQQDLETRDSALQHLCNVDCNYECILKLIGTSGDLDISTSIFKKRYEFARAYHSITNNKNLWPLIQSGISSWKLEATLQEKPSERKNKI